jgi:hypothetical protein
LGNTIYTGLSEDGGLYALNLKTGNVIFNTNSGFYLTFASPAVAGGIVITGCMNGSLFAVDANNGKIKSRFDTDGRLLNPINAILPNGDLNPSVFDPVSGYPCQQLEEYVQRVLTAGSILSSPVVNNNEIYFGSTDSCFYAVNYNTKCNPEINVNCTGINVGNVVKSSVDTAYYISNKGNCSDSVKVTCAPSWISKYFEISPDSFIVAPNDSVKVHININTDSLTSADYTVNLISQSQSNRYVCFNTAINFNKLTTNIESINMSKPVNVYPNPFDDRIYISYSVSNYSFMDIGIYNNLGIEIKRLVNNKINVNGDYTISWDGSDEKGNKTPGVYFCIIKTDKSIDTKEIIYIK